MRTPLTRARDDVFEPQHRAASTSELKSTLLVEAAAGTGKTSILAGRVVLLLASGIHPGNIAAITFTEPAAGELRVRVARFVKQLPQGGIPDDLRIALPQGLSRAQAKALREAAPYLDELTSTTIHGFCHLLLCSYAIEADIDPGAQVLDAMQAEFAFRNVFDRWLRRRLGKESAPGDPIALMARWDPDEAVPGRPKVRVREHLGTAEFMIAYNRAIESQPMQHSPREGTVGSFRRLCVGYYDSAAFTQLDPGTQKWRRHHLDLIASEHADKPAALLEPRHIRSLRDEFKDQPSVANNRLKALRALFAWAVEEEQAPLDPTIGVRLLRYVTQGHHSWSLEEVEQFETRHPIGTREVSRSTASVHGVPARGRGSVRTAARAKGQAAVPAS